MRAGQLVSALVRIAGFEPATSCSQSKRATTAPYPIKGRAVGSDPYALPTYPLRDSNPQTPRSKRGGYTNSPKRARCALQDSNLRPPLPGGILDR